ncbi:MAG: hypothetical protein J3R72DRAFT_44252 [Linnemannia gamsii]|nr:MAG: hypothetical protein J3R72DRAFT_44252 [Linnemannia gamsii]
MFVILSLCLKGKKKRRVLTPSGDFFHMLFSLACPASVHCFFSLVVVVFFLLFVPHPREDTLFGKQLFLACCRPLLSCLLGVVIFILR